MADINSQLLTILMDNYPGWSPDNYVMGNPVNSFDPDGMGFSLNFRKALSAAAMGITAVVVDGLLPFFEIAGGVYLDVSLNHLSMGIGKVAGNLVKSKSVYKKAK